MDLAVGYGLICVFFAIIIVTLYVARGRDRDFTDYSVAGRRFGSLYQTMSFLNTWWPGTTFISFAGLAAGAGVIGFYGLSYSTFTVVLMYLMARRVWLWGDRHNLHTQSDLLGMRYNSRGARTVGAVIGIVSQFPWIILGMQAMGLVFSYLSFGHLTFSEAIIVGVAFIVVRQFWTIQMGMRGVVLTDMVQGIVAYLIGPLLLLGMLGWLAATGHGLGAVRPAMFTIPGLGSADGPLYLFALVLTGTVGGWCWPGIFVRLFTANGVRSLKNSAALALPLSYVFYALIMLVAIMASTLRSVAAAPDDVFFRVPLAIGGPWIVTLAGIIVFAATMGNVDGNLQSNGAQVANDLAGDYLQVSDHAKTTIAKVSIGVLTVLAAFVASFNFSSLATLAIMAYQGIVQLAVPQFLGIFWRRGNKAGAIAGMIAGFITAAVLQVIYPTSIPWLAGLTSGVAGMIVNTAIYVGCAYALPQSAAERTRVDDLFESTRQAARVPAGTGVPATAGD